jgi:pimeloyl-ACP methyl ester carboxylesterase
MKRKLQSENLFDLDLLKAPNAFLMAMEARAPWEYGASLFSMPWLRKAPPGDGHAVVVFPGLAATDSSTAPLRGFIKERGYLTRGWELNRNLGPRRGVLEESAARVHKLHLETGRKVSLVGWSLGGVYAREIAKLHPKDVRCVITLGTPFTGHPRATNAWRVYELASGEKLDNHVLLAQVREPPPVPTTSIFSRTDGVVAWQCSLQPPGKTAESIEVVASHVGMGFNPATWYAVADRLAQPEGKWKAFHREGWRQWLYSDPYR